MVRKSVSLVAVLASFVVAVAATQISREPDTRSLVAGAQRAFECLTADQLNSPCDASHFPPLQMIPALVLVGVQRVFHIVAWPEFRSEQIILALGFINLIAFVFVARKLWEFFEARGGRDLAFAGLALILSGPWVVYATSSFGEGLAAAVLVGLVIQLSHPTPKFGWLFLWVFLAVLLKDTAWPFIVLMILGFEGSRLQHAGFPEVNRRWPWRRLGLLTAAFGTGVLAFGLWNQFRFGQWTNTVLLSEHFRVPNSEIQRDYFLALLLSPKGGLLFFWPAACVILGIDANATLRDRRVSGLARISLLFGVLLGLSFWFSPMGWNAWGSRLILPWVAALSVWALVDRSDEAVRLVNRIRQKSAFKLGTLAALLFVSAPHYHRVFSAHFQSGMHRVPETCLRDTHIEEDAAEYYRCMRLRLWYWEGIGGSE